MEMTSSNSTKQLQQTHST